MRKILMGEKGELLWDKPTQMDKKIHKSETSLMETISWKKVLNTHCIDQLEAVDPWQEPRLGGELKSHF